MKQIGTKLIFRSVLLAPLIFATHADASLIPPPRSVGPERIRVRIAEATPEVSIRGFDLEIYETRSSGKVLPAKRSLASAPRQATEWEFRCQDSRIRAIPLKGGPTLTLRSPVVITSPAGMIRLKDKPYRDELQIHSVGSFCEVVNALDIEKYLGGLVNAEFSSQWSLEAVQAQVIAARTYAMYQIRQARAKATLTGKSASYDVDATVKDQVYDGFGSEDYRGSQAVEKTRGIVLLAKDETGRLSPIKAFYSSSCAGQTQLPEDVWGRHFPGFRHRVMCPYCAMSAKVAWNLQLSLHELATIFKREARADGAQPGWSGSWKRVLKEGQLVDVQVSDRDTHDRGLRVSTVRTLWSWEGHWVNLPISSVRLRDWLGPARLKSTAFQLSLNRATGGVTIAGRGNGHGVGMCQLGAKYLGERGLKAAAILKHYYPDALLQKLW